MSRKPRSIDRALGIETSRKERLRNRPGDGPLARLARDYEPTPPEVFEALLTAVHQPLEAASFVDLGAGKGRVLCLAAGRPFARVVGVELFESLAEIARANLGRLDPAYVRTGELRCDTGDAGAWRFPPGPKVVFLFNPFGPRVLTRALRRMGEERDEEGRGPPVDVLYYEPVAAAVLDACPWLERSAEAAHWTAWRARTLEHGRPESGMLSADG